MALGEKIRELRDELAMSQAQLATQGGLSQGYLSQLENDEVQNPSAAVIFGLARALHVDPRVLMNAAGYGDAAERGAIDEGYAVEVDPDLLRFLARIPRENQAHLLKVLEGIEGGQQPAIAAPRPAPTTHRGHIAGAGRKVAAK
jgi:transcriptional regulator with XRE-family HTH domain